MQAVPEQFKSAWQGHREEEEISPINRPSVSFTLDLSKHGND
jgi:hypothetical protein